MRCFIGIPVVSSLGEACMALSRGQRGAVPAENLHLTLAFLGELPVSRARGLSPELEQVGRGHRPFTLVLTQCEPFPGHQGPFMALTGPPSPALAALHRDLWSCLEQRGIERERRTFRPHITLARPGEAVASQPGQWPLKVDRLWLYQSELGDSGPRYRCISEHWLENSG